MSGLAEFLVVLAVGYAIGALVTLIVVRKDR